MTPTFIRWIAASGWLIATYATLQLHRLDLDLGHGICGPWGCGPPVEALIANHGFWLMLIIPPLLGLQQHLSTAAGWRLGVLLFAVGGACGLAVLAWDLYQFVSLTPFREYWPQRIAFAMAVGVEYPTFHIAIAGLILMGCTRMLVKSVV